MTTLEKLQFLTVIVVVLGMVHAMLRGRRHVIYCDIIISMSNSYYRHLGRKKNGTLRILTLSAIAVVHALPLTRHRDRLAVIKNIANPNFMKYKHSLESLDTNNDSMEALSVQCEIYCLEARFLASIGGELGPIDGSVTKAGDYMMEYVDFLRNEIKQGRFDPWNKTD